MNYCIEQLDRTGLVKTVFTDNERTSWTVDPENLLNDSQIPSELSEINEKELNSEELNNYRALAAEMGITLSQMVRAHQVHGGNVRIVTSLNGGERIIRQSPENDYDGLITNEKNLLLLTLEADCTPVYILDPVNEVIAMLHSGWRSTAAEISANAIKSMHENFGSDAENLIAAMGPCICRECYEVGKELIAEFEKSFDKEEIGKIFTLKNDGSGKYLLDLSEAVKLTLIKAAVREENIFMPPYCTCHSKTFPSYRRNKVLKPHMLTGIMLI